ncbi:GtrA family protein [Bombilactobacillus bombi]|uniref:GtrA family protein n=1 Tax=Bombilactobacillus bombi TaxID=1303590 RepID=A0A347STE9_9LACO|nr:GtrA family protein [Bombilactobacillus bombi]AXX65308.1 GtrA family protein [Bombilactobacillus bombi]RHW52280.1 GtrA family protein [Bombilactobacillus bombi]
MKNLIKKYWDVISYLIFGGLTTLINLLVFYELYTWHHILGYQVANVIAWLLSVIFAYLTNKQFVFNSHQSSKKAVLKELESFFFFRFLSLIIDMGILKVGIGIMQANSLIVKLLDNIIVVIANYVFSKVFIFKEK